jgi:quinol monooxygenase YgiN
MLVSPPKERDRMPVVVVATIRPLPEHRDEVVAAIKETIALVHTEDGCELYSLNEAPDRLMMIEKWASREALDAHLKAANLAALGPRLAGKVAGPADIVVLQPAPAGDPAKGQV